MAAEPLFLDSVAKMENYAVQSGFVSVGSTVLSSKIRAHNLLGGQNRSREAKRLRGAYFVASKGSEFTGRSNEAGPSEARGEDPDGSSSTDPGRQGRQVGQVVPLSGLHTRRTAEKQAQRSVGNTTKWLMQFRGLTRPSSGVSGKAAILISCFAENDVRPRRLVQPTPQGSGCGHELRISSNAKVSPESPTGATLAITGALRTTPMEMLDAHSGTLPMELALRKICFRSIIRLLTLPDTKDSSR